MNPTSDLSQQIQAAFLCRIDAGRIAMEVGAEPRQIEAWRNGSPVPAEFREPIEMLAMSRVLSEIERVGQAVVEQPHLILGDAFRGYLNDLNLAHWLVFGQSFLRYLRQWRQEQQELGK